MRANGAVAQLRLAVSPLLTARYRRYGLISLAAMLLDVNVYIWLLGAGMAAAAAAVAGYLAGCALHWILSSRLVFADGAYAVGTMARQRQKALFVVSALIGLGLTVVVIDVSSGLGAGPLMAKALAIGISFQAVWFVRRALVFTGAR